MEAIERFKDNPSGIITEEQSGRAWLPKDSWQDLGKWQNWDEVKHYVRLMNQVYAGGLSSWRLPSREEALSLFDANLSHKDWQGEVVHIHPFFVEKCSAYIWVDDVNEEGKALHLNLRDGSLEYIDKTERLHQAARLVCVCP